MLELFLGMIKEEWRLHSTLFGSLSFALFPVFIFGLACMGSFLIPLFSLMLPPEDLFLLVHANFVLLGIMVGGFGLLGSEVMNRRFGQASLLAYSSRSLPLSDRQIFLNFVIKDIVYYLILWVFPFVAGIAVAAPFVGLPKNLVLLFFVSLTLSFLTGLSIIFFLSTLYARSRLLFGVAFSFILISLTAIFLNSYTLPAPLLNVEVLWNDHLITVLALAGIAVAILFCGSILLFDPGYSGRTKRFRNRMVSLVKTLSFFPYPPLAAKDLLDLYRSGGGIGQIIFSFLLPLGFIWFFLSLLSAFLPRPGTLLVFAVTCGIISSTMYTWLTAFDSFSAYASLPISVTALIISKICSFSVLQLVPAVFIISVALVSGNWAYLLPALVLCISTSYYALSVSVFLTGLSPNLLIYDVRVLALFLVLVGSVVLLICAISFVNPINAFLSILLFIPAGYLVKKSFSRWESKDIAGF